MVLLLARPVLLHRPLTESVASLAQTDAGFCHAFVQSAERNLSVSCSYFLQQDTRIASLSDAWPLTYTADT